LKTKSPTFTQTETVIIPTIPQEIIDEILDHLATNSKFRSLQACALTSKSWVQSCRRHLFHTAIFTSGSVREWFETFPVPEESPAHHVRDLRIYIGGQDWVPQNFFEYTSWFTNVRILTLLGRWGFPPFWTPSLYRLPRSVTSLTIEVNVCTLTYIRDIIAQLPNLDDLSLSESLISMDEDVFPGIGTTLGGRFGGKLALLPVHDTKDFMNMLLEIPTGLRFTEVEIRCTRGCFPLAVRLTEACSETLVNLSYMVTRYGESHPFSWSS